MSPRPLHRRRRRGAAALETALVLPILVTLIAGALESAWYLHTRYIVADAARAGARAAAVATTTASINTQARNAVRLYLANQGLDPNTANVLVTTDTSVGTLVKIDVRVPYEPLVGLVPSPGTLLARSCISYEDVSN